MTLIHKALLFAADRHQGQDRDGDSALPYFCHPIEVLNNLRWVAEVTEEADLCAALLHDVVEETPTTLEEIESAFGSETADLVRELTRVEPTLSETEGLTRDEIYELRTRIFLQEVSEMSPRAQRIKLCDRLSNLREAKLTRTEKKYRRYLAQTERLLKVIPRSVCPPVWDQISLYLKELL